MGQDVVADALNQIMNSKRVEKSEVRISRSSKVLVNILEMMKKRGHIDYEVKSEGGVIVRVIKLNECRAVKPRYYAKVSGIEKYLRRFLPSRSFGTLVVSTNGGLLDQKECYDKKIGGSIIAYFY